MDKIEAILDFLDKEMDEYEGIVEAEDSRDIEVHDATVILEELESIYWFVKKL